MRDLAVGGFVSLMSSAKEGGKEGRRENCVYVSSPLCSNRGP